MSATLLRFILQKDFPPTFAFMQHIVLVFHIHVENVEGYQHFCMTLYEAGHVCRFSKCILVLTTFSTTLCYEQRSVSDLVNYLLIPGCLDKRNVTNTNSSIWSMLCHALL